MERTLRTVAGGLTPLPSGILDLQRDYALREDYLSIRASLLRFISHEAQLRVQIEFVLRADKNPGCKLLLAIPSPNT